jgi:tetratricopeptide (TPR) repeat protein
MTEGDPNGKTGLAAEPSPTPTGFDRRISGEGPKHSVFVQLNDWAGRFYREFRKDQPGKQLAQLYYLLAVVGSALAVAGFILSALWGFSKFFLSDVQKQSVQLGIVREVIAKDNPVEETTRALDRLRGLVSALVDLRNREPPLVRDIDESLQALAKGDTSKAEALLRGQVRSAGRERQEKAEFQRYLAAVVFIHSKDQALMELKVAVEADPENGNAWNDLGDVALAIGASHEADHAFREALKLAHQQKNAPFEVKCLIRFGETLIIRGHAAAGANSFEQAFRLVELELQHDNANENLLGLKALVLVRQGTYRVSVGDREGALKAYQESITIRNWLAERDSSNTGWQRDLSVSNMLIGDILRDKGDRDGALKAYQDCLAIDKKLAERDPSNTKWQR